MPQPRNGHRKIVIGVLLAACACLLMMASFNLFDSNAKTRATVEEILLSESSPEKKLQELVPYVKIGENISAVHKRITPDKTEFRVEHPTEHAYGLKESNLVLAIRADGTIAGIGRHKYGTDDGTVWFASPEW